MGGKSSSDQHGVLSCCRRRAIGASAWDGMQVMRLSKNALWASVRKRILLLAMSWRWWPMVAELRFPAPGDARPGSLPRGPGAPWRPAWFFPRTSPVLGGSVPGRPLGLNDGGGGKLCAGDVKAPRCNIGHVPYPEMTIIKTPR
jgi:hypothetical protein